MGSIEILSPGLATTVQDLGRPAYRRYGISPCGAMDAYSLRMANVLVGNGEGEACLETTMIGPRIRFHADECIAVTGSETVPLVNGEPARMWRQLLIAAGDVLSFQPVRSTCRAYVAFAGGLDAPSVMGSKSTFLRGGYGGWHGRLLRAGDVIPIGPVTRTARPGVRKVLPARYRPDYGTDRPVRFVWGPRQEAFTPESQRAFAAEPFTVRPESDRMGYRLQGPKLERIDDAEPISDYVAVGSIQVPGDGQPIVLMADCQVTGGYPKIGVVISVDIAYLAHKKPGDRIAFQPVELEEAQWYWKLQEKTIRTMLINSAGQ